MEYPPTDGPLKPGYLCALGGCLEAIHSDVRKIPEEFMKLHDAKKHIFRNHKERTSLDPFFHVVIIHDVKGLQPSSFSK